MVVFLGNTNLVLHLMSVWVGVKNLNPSQMRN